MKPITALLPFIFIAAVIFSLLSLQMPQSAQLQDITTPEVGDTLPEIELPTPGNRLQKLSALRGSIVLVVFWASWCDECRVENPNIVSTYHQYKDAQFSAAQGFAVFQVSLDDSKGRWIHAIKQDGLVWDYHVSDLHGYECRAAVDYGIKEIPCNFLIDSSGVVIAKDIKGRELKDQLKKQLKKR